MYNRGNLIEFHLKAILTLNIEGDLHLGGALAVLRLEPVQSRISPLHLGYIEQRSYADHGGALRGQSLIVPEPAVGDVVWTAAGGEVQQARLPLQNVLGDGFFGEHRPNWRSKVEEVSQKIKPIASGIHDCKAKPYSYIPSTAFYSIGCTFTSVMSDLQAHATHRFPQGRGDHSLWTVEAHSL